MGIRTLDRLALGVFLCFVASGQSVIERLLSDQPQVTGVAAGPRGEIYFVVTQPGFGGGFVQRLDPSTGAVSTIAGGGQSLGDGIPATSALLPSPSHVIFDLSGHLLVSEAARIRRIDLASGIITTVAGTGIAGFSGDGGPALAAQLDQPGGMAFDGAGNLFVADTGNRRVRRIDAQSGGIATVAGNGQDDYVGSIGSPADVAVGANGAVFVASPNVHRVFRVALDGATVPIAGNGSRFESPNPGPKVYTGDGGPALLATLCGPSSLAVDAAGLLIGDQDCHAIRRWNATTGVIETVVLPNAGAPPDGSLGLAAPLAIALRGGVLFIGDRYGRVWRALPAAPASPPPEIEDVLDGTTFQHVQVSPGAIVTITGNYLAPATPAFLQLDADGRVSTELAGVRAFFGDSPAVLLYVSAAQINAVVPYLTPGGTIPVRVVTSAGEYTKQFGVSVNLSNPGFFAVLNPDGTVNTRDNPAPQESVLVFFGTGMGRTDPPGVDGAVYPGPSLPLPTATVRATADGQPAEVLFLGQAPNFVSGVMQGNVRMPEDLPARTRLNLTIASRTSGVDVFLEKQEPVPVITGVGPADLRATVGEQGLEIQGAGFESDSTVDLFRDGARIASLPATPSGIAGTRLNTLVNFGGTPGPYEIQVVNSSNRRSGRLALSVAPPGESEVPRISSVFPVDLGGMFVTAVDQEMAVTGVGITSAATVDLFYEGSLFAHLAGPSIQPYSSGLAFVVNFGNRAGAYAIEVITPSGIRSPRFSFVLQRAPAPVVSGVVPASPAATSGPQTLTFQGTTLLKGLSVELFREGSLIQTFAPAQITPLSTPLSFSISVNFNGVAGSYAIEVISPDAQRSARFAFTVKPLDAQPFVTALQPAAPVARAAGEDIQVLGANFQPGLSVDIFRAGNLVATISGGNVSSVTPGSFTMRVRFTGGPGAYALEVINPGGTRSPRFAFTVVAPPPEIGALQTSPVVATSSPQNLTFTGSNFQSGLSVDLFYNGLRTATLGGPQISAVSAGSFTVTINFNGVAGAYGIEAMNPDGGRSARFLFAAEPQQGPSVTSFTGFLTAQIDPGVFEVNGQNFQPGLRAELFLDGALTATFSGDQIQYLSPLPNPTRFELHFSFNDRAGQYGIEVVNPGGQRSNRFLFTVAPVPVTVSTIDNERYALAVALPGTLTYRVGGTQFAQGLSAEIFRDNAKILTAAGTQIHWQDSRHFTMDADFAAQPGVYAIEVVNPSGNRSARREFTIYDPHPQITSVTPVNGSVIGTTTSQIYVNGANFYGFGTTVNLYRDGTKVDSVNNFSGSSRFVYFSSSRLRATFGFPVAGSYAIEVVFVDIPSNRFSFEVVP